jgi:type IX secretion system PorP/SprF family membrane protein
MKRLILPFFLCISIVGSAQLYPVFTQYFFNELVINPAYAGAHVQLSTTATFRNQWINFPGAPKTFSFSSHSSFLRGKIGLGLLMNVDKIGSYANKDISTMYSYKLKFRDATLSFGLQGSLYFVGADFSKLFLKAPDDPGFVPINQLKPNIGTGVYFHKKNFFVGFSVPFLINSKFVGATSEVGTALKQFRYYFLRSGFIFPLDPKGNLKINPSILVRTQEGQPMSVDINASIIMYDVLSTGLSYRSGDALISFVSLKLTEQFYFNYSFDFTHSHLNPFSSGTHELMLNYRAKITSVHKNLSCPTYHNYRE